jgi:hypothetical protein
MLGTQTRIGHDAFTFRIMYWLARYIFNDALGKGELFVAGNGVHFADTRLKKMGSQVYGYYGNLINSTYLSPNNNLMNARSPRQFWSG